MAKMTREDVVEALKSDFTDLKGMDLSNLDLSNLDIDNVDFFGSNLTKTNFSRSRLGRGVGFNQANLRGANLSHTKMSGVWFQQANLTGADLSCSQIVQDGYESRGAILDRAILRGACLDGFMTEVSLQNADLTGATISRHIDNVDLSGAILRGVTISGGIRNSNLSNTDMRGADLRLVTGSINSVNFSGANLAGVIIERGDSYCKFMQIQYNDQTIWWDDAIHPKSWETDIELWFVAPENIG